MFIAAAPPILMSRSLCIEETTFNLDNQPPKHKLFRRQSTCTDNYCHCPYTNTVQSPTQRKQNTVTLKTHQQNSSTWYCNTNPPRCHLLDPCNPFYCNSLPSVFSSALPSPADGSSSPPPAGDAPPPAWSPQSRLLNPGSEAHWTHENITCSSNIKVLNDYTSEKFPYSTVLKYLRRNLHSSSISQTQTEAAMVFLEKQKLSYVSNWGKKKSLNVTLNKILWKPN